MTSTQSAFSTAFGLLRGLWISHVVSATVKLGIAAALDAGPRTAAELAMSTGSGPGCLYRLLRTAAALGVLDEDADGRFHANSLTPILRPGPDPNMNGIAAFFSDEWHTRAWEKLLETVRTGRPGIDLAYGIPFFEYLARNPAPAATFFQGMTDFSSIEGPAVVDAFDFGRFDTVCDAGGGHGLLLARILERHPHIGGVLFDQPAVIAEAKARGLLESFGGRARMESGDIFEAVPAGANALVLKRIVHDWSDEDCVRILRNCRAAIAPGGKLLIVEQVIVKGESSLSAKLMDLEMMVLLGGRERDEEGFRRILAESGWKLERIIGTESGMSILECGIA